MPVKIVVIDHHEVVRLGLRAMFADQTTLQIVADTDNLDSGFKQIIKHKPDAVLLDMHLPQTEGVLALQRFREEFPSTPVVVFTHVDNTTLLARAMALGAQGMLLKSQSQTEIQELLLRAAQGEITWTRGEQRRASTNRNSGKAQQIGGVAFTAREVEVLKLLIEGLTNREIGKILKISYETVKEHIQHLLRKIQVGDRTQAAVWAIRQGVSSQLK